MWGMGAARTAATDLRRPFFFGIGGVALGAVGGALAAALLTLWLSRRSLRPEVLGNVALRFLPLLLPILDVLASSHIPWRGPVLLVGSAVAFGLALVRLPSWGWGALAVLIPLGVYVADLSPYVGRADTFEFQVVGPQLGIAHPSGYPLYTLIAKLFSWLPLSSVAWRVNFSSAVCAALAAGFLFLALVEAWSGIGPGREPGGTMERTGAGMQGLSPSQDRIGPHRGLLDNAGGLVFLATALALAFSPTLWSRAIEAEVYALNACLVAAGLWLAVRWHGRTLRPAVAWPALGLLLGLAVASHVTLGALVLLVAPGLLVSRLRPPGRRACVRSGLLALGLGVLGVLLYLYIPLRWPAVTGGEVMSAAEFWQYVTNAGSGGALRPMAFVRDPGRWALVGRLLQAQFGWAGLILAVIGLVWLGRRSWTLTLGLLGAFGAWVWFNLSFYVADPDYSAFLIPAHVLVAFWLGLGTLAAMQVVATWRRALAFVWSVGVLLLALAQVWQTGPLLDTRAQGAADEAWARYVLQLPLVQDAAILADSEKFPPLYYLQQVEGLRPDLELVTLFSEQQYREALEARMAAGQQVYLARYLPGVDGYGVTSVGPLVAVGTRGSNAPEPSTGVRFGNALVLSGHELVQGTEREAYLTLTWHVLAPVEQDLDVRMRLVRPGDGSVVWELNAGRPVAGYTATQSWQPGWTVDDTHTLNWPEWLPGDRYGLEVALFPHFEREGLPVSSMDEIVEARTPWHRLGEVDVAVGPAPALPNPHTALFGRSTWLVGSRAPGEVPAGSEMAVDLAWICQAAVRDGSGPYLRWVDTKGAGGVERSADAVSWQQVTACRVASGGNPVIRRTTLAAPERPGVYRLEVAWRGTEGEWERVRCHWLGQARDACSIGNVTVGPADQGLAIYDHRFLLLDATYDAQGVPAGGPLHVDLRWRSLEAVSRDYTVFVQVIGPDGRLYGQVDSWPGQGARPTSGWRVGEEISDRYSFYVEPGAPAGRYRLIVGWYLLADMSRLPVVDSTGCEVGDFYEMGTFELGQVSAAPQH